MKVDFFLKDPPTCMPFVSVCESGLKSYKITAIYFLKVKRNLVMAYLAKQLVCTKIFGCLTSNNDLTQYS
jgi:hypothetical protein